MTGSIRSSHLRRALTSQQYSDRILGSSTQVDLPSDTIWAATGNNLRPRGEMTRRCFLVRLDTEQVRPYRRKGFTHDQPAWTREHRSELAAALLTIARGWVVAGRPEPDDPPVLGSFMPWVRVLGGILQNAGVEGFLQNLDKLEDTAHSEDDQWAGLLHAVHEWLEYRNEETFQAGTLVRRLEQDIRGYDRIQDERLRKIARYLPDRFQTKLRKGDSFTNALGTALDYQEDRRFAGDRHVWYLERIGKNRDGVIWKVRRDDVAEKDSDARTPDPHSSENEEGGRGGAFPEDGNLSSRRHTEAEEAPF